MIQTLPAPLLQSQSTSPSEHAAAVANEATSRFVRVLLNGTPHELPTPTLLAALAQLSLNAETRHLAIAVNESVVPRAQWDNLRLNTDDRIEVITAVAGG